MRMRDRFYSTASTCFAPSGNIVSSTFTPSSATASTSSTSSTGATYGFVSISSAFGRAARTFALCTVSRNRLANFSALAEVSGKKT